MKTPFEVLCKGLPQVRGNSLHLCYTAMMHSPLRTVRAVLLPAIQSRELWVSLTMHTGVCHILPVCALSQV
jgi:hypothetical protein